MIVFNQRFSIDKLHIIEVYLIDILISRGFQVLHLSSEESAKQIMSDRESRALLKRALKQGLQFQVCTTKDEYYRSLAKSSTLISTSIADTLSIATLEAAALDVVPIAPKWGPFPEYLNPENLYRPYNINQIIEMTASPPKNKVDLQKYKPEKVVDIYIKTMGVF